MKQERSSFSVSDWTEITETEFFELVAAMPRSKSRVFWADRAEYPEHRKGFIVPLFGCTSSAGPLPVVDCGWSFQ
jgi:hypothetical protein